MDKKLKQEIRDFIKVEIRAIIADTISQIIYERIEDYVEKASREAILKKKPKRRDSNKEVIFKTDIKKEDTSILATGTKIKIPKGSIEILDTVIDEDESLKAYVVKALTKTIYKKITHKKGEQFFINANTLKAYHQKYQ